MLHCQMAQTVARLGWPADAQSFVKAKYGTQLHGTQHAYSISTYSPTHLQCTEVCDLKQVMHIAAGRLTLSAQV